MTTPSPRQVWTIGGGTAFDHYDDYLTFLRTKELTLERLLRQGWKSTLQDRLGDDYLVIPLPMPCTDNARYTEWRIRFGRALPLMTPGAILIGHSLGGIFLAKYLSEERLPVTIRGTILIAAPFADATGESLGDFVLTHPLTGLIEQGGTLALFYSEDDPVVPLTELDHYRAVLPAAHVYIYPDRGHFHQPEFPELIAEVQGMV